MYKNRLSESKQAEFVMSETKTKIPTNLRTLRILELVGQADRPMTPTEIGKALGLPKQSIHRLCGTLLEEGFLIPDLVSKGLRPARRAREMASGILYTSQYHIVRHQVLQSIAAQVSETVNFVVPQEKGMIYLDRVETDWPFRIQLPVGTHVPFHCTASGKTFLASLPPKARTAVVSGLKLNRLTENTITNPDKLLNELKVIRNNGYALDREEFVDGMIAIAVPIRDQKGKFVAAVAFHGPTQRLTPQSITDRRHILIDGAKRLAAAILA